MDNSDMMINDNMENKPFLCDVPVLCLFFNRPDLFRSVFEQVKLARPSKLFLYQDGPRNDSDMPEILACREIASQVDWDCEVHTMYLENNQGCDPSGYLSRKWAFQYVDRLVILEDDTVPSVSFFSFCKELLEKYLSDNRITMIAGMNYEEETKDCPYDYLFTSDCSIWGWATWKRVFDRWESNYDFLSDEYHMKLLSKYIKNTNLRKHLIPMFKRHKASGKEFFESILISDHILQHGLSIVPTKNLISNIGFTSDSTHFNGSIKTVPKTVSRLYTMKRFEAKQSLKHPPYVIENLYYKESIDKLLARNKPIVKFFRRVQTFFLRIVYGDFSSIKKSIIK